VAVEGEFDTPEVESCRGGDSLRVTKAVASSAPAAGASRRYAGLQGMMGLSYGTARLTLWSPSGAPMTFCGLHLAGEGSPVSAARELVFVAPEVGAWPSEAPCPRVTREADSSYALVRQETPITPQHSAAA